METIIYMIITFVSALIFLGYLSLIIWPILCTLYVGAIFILQKMKERSQRLLNEKEANLKEVWSQLRRLNNISWSSVENAIELSSKTKKVGVWLKKLGVHHVDNLKCGRISEYSMSFPDQYDLVTSLQDTKKYLIYLWNMRKQVSFYTQEEFLLILNMLKVNILSAITFMLHKTRDFSYKKEVTTV